MRIINYHLDSRLYLNDTLNQLQKDCLMIGINFNFKDPIRNYKDLFECTFEFVNYLEKHYPKKVFDLLYRIDLPEEFIRNEIEKTEYSFRQIIAELIVKRELYKVVLRKRVS